MFLDLKIRLEILAYGFLKFILNKVFMRHGDVLPAHILKKIDPAVFDRFAKKVIDSRIPVILVTGTNGKTTTANLISEVFENSGKAVCSNKNGANMPNGIFGAIMNSYAGPAAGMDIIVMETDEKVFPYVSSKLIPDTVVVTNLFRDQLDRYGEVNMTALKIKESINGLPHPPNVVLPSYEPLAAFAGSGTGPKIYFGLTGNLTGENSGKIHIGGCYGGTGYSDSPACPECGHILNYEETAKNIFFSKFKCDSCGFKSSDPAVVAASIPSSGSDEAVMLKNKNSREDDIVFKPSLKGDYNIANYAAAYSVLNKFGVKGEIIKKSFEDFRPRFGRSYKTACNGIEFSVDLVKNPSGFNRVLEKITRENEGLTALLAFSDRDADGRDVSWIWDVDFELYANKFENVVITGLRPFDMALRLKTAGIGKEKIKVEHNMKKSIEYVKTVFLNGKHTGGGISVMSTYTELANLKRSLLC